MQQVIEIKIIVSPMRMYLQIDDTKLNRKMPKCVYKHATKDVQYYDYSESMIQMIESIAKELTYLIRYNKVSRPEFENRSWRETKNIITRV